MLLTEQILFVSSQGSKRKGEKCHKGRIVQALYATPPWACVFLMNFILGGYVKYNFLEGGGVDEGK